MKGNIDVQALSSPTELAGLADNEPAQTPCHQVDGFGHYLYDPAIVPKRVLLDWPPVWVAVVLDEVFGQIHVDAVYTNPEAARDDARKMAIKLMCDQAQRRQAFTKLQDGEEADEDYWKAVAQFEREVSLESVLHGPLTKDGSWELPLFGKEVLEEIVGVQREVALSTLLHTEKGLQLFPVHVRRRIYAYAYSPRALPEPLYLPERQREVCKCLSGFTWAMDVPGCSAINGLWMSPSAQRSMM